MMRWQKTRRYEQKIVPLQCVVLTQITRVNRQLKVTTVISLIWDERIQVPNRMCLLELDWDSDPSRR